MAEAAGCLLAVGGSKAFYDYFRVKSGRPILNGRPTVDLYYITYLAMFTLGIAIAVKSITG